MPSKITLTRSQVLKLATFLALDENIKSIAIEESHTSGIGPGHKVWFIKDQIEKSFEEDISDVSTW